MPRPVKVRVSFRDDTAFFIRFQSAVLRDPNLPDEWKKKAASLANQLAEMCIQADGLRDASREAGS